MKRNFIKSESLDREATISHAFFGTSYQMLQGQALTEDDTASARICEILGVDNIAYHLQRHTKDAFFVGGPQTHEETQLLADALVTTTKGLAIGIKAADCVPILLADVKAGVIGAAHAGWPGALKGITDAVIDRMVEHGASPADIIAVLGPSISQGNYEVGPELYEKFVTESPIAVDAFFVSGEGDRLQFDNKEYVAARLRTKGVEQIEVMPVCTFDEYPEFQSKRAADKAAGGHNQGKYQNNISAIALMD